MNRIDIADRFAEMWRKSREESGRSQEYVAKALGVSKKTVQNWEAGISSPSQMKGFEWFDALDIQPLPYYLKLLYPTEYSNLSAEGSDDQIEEALIRYIKATSPEMRRKILFILFGNHGSSPRSVIEMVVAHLHTPLQSRLNVAHDVFTNYDVAEATDQLVCMDNVPPDLVMLKEAYDTAVNAVKQGKTTYSVMEGGKDCQGNSSVN